MSKARLKVDVEAGANGSGGVIPAGTVVRTVFDAPAFEHFAPIPPRMGTMRVGITNDHKYVMLTPENCEAVEDDEDENPIRDEATYSQTE